MEIRLHDLPADVEAFTAALIDCPGFEVVSKSADYPDRRGMSAKVRRYLDVRLRPSAESVGVVLAALLAEVRAVLDDEGADRQYALESVEVQLAALVEVQS